MHGGRGQWGLSSHRRRAARCGAWGDLYPGRPVAAATTRKRQDCSTRPAILRSVILGLGVSPMRRREFIALLSSGVAAWPLAARAQQSAMLRVGFVGIQPGGRLG